MQPIRQIIDDAPAQVAIPPELRHRRIELIMRPLDEGPADVRTAREQAIPEDQRRNPCGFLIAKVDRIEIPSREERNARR